MSLAMSKVSDEQPPPASAFPRTGRLTASRRQAAPQPMAWEAVEDDDDSDEEGQNSNDDENMSSSGGYGHAPPETVPYSNIAEIIPGLFIGDVTAAMDQELLKSKNITCIVAAMRQRYPAPEGVTMHRVYIDDTSKTNILRYFEDTNAFIRKAREEGKSVLVHCQAGVSRSSTLCAAFLMEELDLTAEEAIEKIASVRSVVQPLEFFLHQLELFERCNFDLDPNKYSEYRRFLMNFNAQDMIDGDGVDDLILAYYSTPAPSPRRSPSLPDPFLSMTPLSGSSTFTARPGRSRRGSSTSITSEQARSEILARVRRGSVGANSMSSNLAMSSISGAGGSQPTRRLSEGQSMHFGGGLAPLTRRKSSRAKSATERDSELKQLRGLLDEKKTREAEEVSKAKQGLFADQEGPLVATPKPSKTAKLRCKMCRRELASREHVLDHDPGQGQRAFAPTRRDMTQHRKDTEKRRQEKAQEREARQAERQRLAAAAAEELILEEDDSESSSDCEDANMSSSANEPAEETSGTTPSAKSSGQAEDTQAPVGTAGPSDNASKSPSHGPVRAQTMPIAGHQNARSLASRLPPQLAALRVAMPARPYGHDYSNAASGSAIDDDDGTPVSEDIPKLLPSSVCTSYFTEPLSWMRAQLEKGDLSGKIVCPNSRCGAKLGNFDWSGLQCSCAAWICPGFALAVSKVDEIWT